jgi:hypothetical protein
MISAHTATLTMLGVDNIPVVGSNCWMNKIGILISLLLIVSYLISQ